MSHARRVSLLARQAAKELALWRVALAFGFVFELQDVMEMLNRDRTPAKGPDAG